MAGKKRGGASKKRAASVKGLTKGATYRFSPDVALELELYGKVGRYGSQKAIIEQSLEEFFAKNPLPKRLREAALLIIEGGE